MSHTWTLGLDYDGTVTRDVELWKRMLRLMKETKVKILIVTMRYESERYGDRLGKHAMDEELLSLADQVIFTKRRAKGPAVSKLGHKVDVWVDDNPQAVFMSAKQIWGNCTPEGVIVVQNEPDTHPLPSLPFTTAPK